MYLFTVSLSFHAKWQKFQATFLLQLSLSDERDVGKSAITAQNKRSQRQRTNNTSASTILCPQRHLDLNDLATTQAVTSGLSQRGHARFAELTVDGGV